MRVKYVARVDRVRDDAGWEAYSLAPLTMNVLVPEDQPRETGLLDQLGNKLYRVTVREPVGFRVR